MAVNFAYMSCLAAAEREKQTTNMFRNLSKTFMSHVRSFGIYVTKTIRVFIWMAPGATPHRNACGTPARVRHAVIVLCSTLGIYVCVDMSVCVLVVCVWCMKCDHSKVGIYCEIAAELRKLEVEFVLILGTCDATRRLTIIGLTFGMHLCSCQRLYVQFTSNKNTQ